jgi:hypothetical protein
MEWLKHLAVEKCSQGILVNNQCEEIFIIKLFSQIIIQEYKNGMDHGNYYHWNSDGYLIRHSEYINDKLHGMDKIYRHDGKLHREVSYSNGIRDGVTITYDEDGNVESEDFYINGKFVGNDYVIQMKRLGKM